MKIKVGENSCNIDAPISEGGCEIYDADFPTDAVKFTISCDYRDKKYAAHKCKYEGTCDFKREVTDRDLKEYPDLFEEGDE